MARSNIEIQSHAPRWRDDGTRRRRWPRYTILAISLFIVGSAVFGWRFLASSLPQIDGELTVKGLTAPVAIIRDTNGIPHIAASGELDAAFAMGYVHAQDRLWQLELQRRVGAGRLSELAGARTLTIDKSVRTIGFYRSAQTQFERMDPASRRLLEAYAAGINAFIGSHKGALPPEFVALRHRPEPWTPADSLVWLKMMSWGLSTNIEEEILRARLAARLTPGQIERVLLNYPDNGPTGVVSPALAALYRQLDWTNMTALSQQLPAAPAASNNWVVSGSRSASGKPLLANDPHLLLPNPSVWYLAHVQTPQGNVVGASLAGMPGIAVGRNDRIAWGVTNIMADVQDLYIEELVDGTNDRYRTPEGPRPFEVRRETIKVRDGDDVELIVRSTRHGPVISDIREEAAKAVPNRHVLSLAWAPLLGNDNAVAGFTRINAARTVDEFRAGVAEIGDFYMNFIYADIDGNIAYQASGRFPRRKPGNSIRGRAPNPGWDASFDWDGWIDFDALPRTLNPASGAIATANHRIVPDSYPHYLTASWMPGYRIKRINQLLAQVPRHDMASFTAMQGDIYSLQAAELLAYLQDASSDDPTVRDALARMRSWDRRMTADRPEPLIWAAWYRHLLKEVLADELGELFEPVVKPMVFGQRYNAMLQIFASDNDWCDDVRTLDRETCPTIAVRALSRALAELQRDFGGDPSSWRWGEAHAAWFKHEPFTHVPVLRRLFDRSVNAAGDAETVNAAAYLPMTDDAATRYRQVHGAGLRMIVDLAALEQSQFITVPGQSGNPMSRHFDDYLVAWRDLKFVPIPTDRGRLIAARTLNLIPAR